MRAAYITAVGPAESLRIGELPMPVPGPTDVLVEVELVAANPVDTYIRSGRYPTQLPFPFVVGRDLVGTVAQAGTGSGYAVGERVWCSGLSQPAEQLRGDQYLQGASLQDGSRVVDDVGVAGHSRRVRSGGAHGCSGEGVGPGGADGLEGIGPDGELVEHPVQGLGLVVGGSHLLVGNVVEQGERDLRADVGDLQLGHDQA